MSCDVGRIIQPLHLFTYVTAHSIALPLLHLRNRHFTYVTVHSTTLPLFYLHHRSVYNPSVHSPTSQIILQPFCCFTYITAHSPTLLLLHLHHSSFSNPSFASPISQALHLCHLASCPWFHLHLHKAEMFLELHSIISCLRCSVARMMESISFQGHCAIYGIFPCSILSFFSFSFRLSFSLFF